MWTNRNKQGFLIITILFIIFIVVISIFNYSQEVFGCNVLTQLGSAWFNDTLTLPNGSSNNLPPGMTIDVSTNKLVVTNSNTIPLYILGQQQSRESYMAVSAIGIPLGFSPLIKIDQQNYFVWRDKQWFNHASSPLYLRSEGKFELVSLTRLYPNIIDWRKIEEIRTTNPLVPAPQNGNLLLLTDNKIYSVPFVISYTLKQNYRPPSYTVRSCSHNYLSLSSLEGWGIAIFIFVLIGVIVGCIERKLQTVVSPRNTVEERPNLTAETEHPLSPPVYTSGEDGEQLPSSQTLNKPIKKK